MLFKEEYRFLSNFLQSPIEIDGITYPTGEHAFQAFKEDSEEYKQGLCTNKNPVVAKRKGRKAKIADIHAWNRDRDDYMLRVVRHKFTQNMELAVKLIETKDLELVEENNWNDTYWGKSIKTGKGLNKLGKILMQVRTELTTPNPDDV